MGNKEKFEDGVLELELSESQIKEFIEKLKLLDEGEDHIHFNMDKHNQFILKKK